MKTKTTKNKVIIGDNSLETLADSLPWEEIKRIHLKKTDLKSLDVGLKTYWFATQKENHPFVVKSALKMLKKTDPENATPEYAETVANMMEIFARMYISEIENMAEC